MPFKSTITLIDVEAKCLAQVDSQTQYVALSYVWGRVPDVLVATMANVDELYLPGSLMNPGTARRIPRTIRDAMALTAKFKIRYLWVDSLCIVQNDLEHKVEQLSQMSAIYFNAFFTIIAADGRDADHGLRGSHADTIPRRDLTALNFPNDVRLYLRGLFQYEESEAPWNSRAWMYQERVLSHRLLVFVRDTVFWQCRTCRKDELNVKELQTEERNKFISPTLDPPRYPDLDAYYMMVKLFNSRSLSFEADAHDAFSAVLQVMSRQFEHGFHYGVPEVALDIGLLWETKQPCPRRSGFPSWSWLGRAGSISMNHLMSSAWPGIRPTSFHGGMRKGVSPTIAPVHQYHKIKRDGSTVLVINSFNSYEASDMRCKGWKRDSLGWTHPEVTEVIFDHPFPRPTGPTFADMRDWTTHLTFSTTSCFLECKTGFKEDDDVNRLLPNERSLRIIDKAGNWMGVLEPDDECPTKACQFISMSILDVGGLFYFLSELSQSRRASGYRCYNVLWIEWEEGIAYRRGIGRIEAQAWERQHLEHIDVVLG